MRKRAGIVSVATVNKNAVMDILKLQEEFSMINIRIDVAYGSMFDTTVDYSNLKSVTKREFIGRLSKVLTDHGLWKLVRER